MSLSYSDNTTRRRTAGWTLVCAAVLSVFATAARADVNASLVAMSSPSAVHPGSDAWWADFGDPVLNSLVSTALSANQDLKIAATRLEQARALAGGAEAERRPRLDAMAGAQRGRSSSADPKGERSVVGLRAAWEVDLFGRAGLAVKAAEADSESWRHGLQAARIALAADVAAAYIALRTLDQRLVLGKEAIELAQRQLDVSVRKFDAGQATSADQERWRAELAQERAALAQLDGERRMRQHQLALLLGVSQVPDQYRLASSAALASALPSPPAPLLPGELLERRPDVMRQARALDAALARAGVARRDLYPRLQIDWSGGQERLAAIGGSAAPRLVVGYGLSLSLPILDGGRIRANIKVQDARVQEAMAEYEKAMMAALVDAESSLVRWSASGRTWEEWEAAMTAAAVAVRTAERLYQAGTSDLGAVLDARRAHLRARDALAQAAGGRWEAAVGVRRAFAGSI